MGIPLSDDITRLIDGRNFAHLATVMSDGAPHSVPVWVGREGDWIIVATDEGSVKSNNTRRDPRVAISIVDVADPYTVAWLRGRVVERRPDPDFNYTDPICQKYIGRAWPLRDAVAVALIIEVDKAHHEKLPFEHTLIEAAKRPA
jgi:PPOX class probable F420-dependent enzyme